MKWIVAIVAAGAFVGCGVGADDPEGLIASGYEAGSSQQALTGDGVAGSVDGGATGQYVAGGSTTFAGAGPVSSPQDPIPAFEGRTSPLPFAPVQQTPSLVAPTGTDPRPGR